jgi:hypothetical protein
MDQLAKKTRFKSSLVRSILGPSSVLDFCAAVVALTAVVLVLMLMLPLPLPTF